MTEKQYQKINEHPLPIFLPLRNICDQDWIHINAPNEYIITGPQYQNPFFPVCNVPRYHLAGNMLDSNRLKSHVVSGARSWGTKHTLERKTLDPRCTFAHLLCQTPGEISTRQPKAFQFLEHIILSNVFKVFSPFRLNSYFLSPFYHYKKYQQSQC